MDTTCSSPTRGSEWQPQARSHPLPNKTTYAILADSFADVQRCNGATWLHNLPPQVPAHLTEAASDVTARTLSLPKATLLTLLVHIEVEFYRANDRPRELQLFQRQHRRYTATRGKARPPPYLVCNTSLVWDETSNGVASAVLLFWRTCQKRAFLICAVRSVTNHTT